MRNIQKSVLFFFVGLSLSCQSTKLVDTVASTDRDVAGVVVKYDIKVAPDRKEAKKYFKAVRPEERVDALRKAEVFLPGWNAEDVRNIDLVEKYLKKNCDRNFQYRNGGQIEWPSITCQYRADDSNNRTLGGGSPKFLCDVPDAKEEKGYSTKQIKYSARKGSGVSGEVSEVLAATHLALLMGFPANYYCPVKVTCEGCPSADPWDDKHASKSPSKKKYQFDLAMIEENFYAPTISEFKSGDLAPRGFAWDETRLVNVIDPVMARRQLVEREALILWGHFIHATDANDTNHRLICTDWEKAATGFKCKSSMIFMNDYGHAFNHMDTENRYDLDDWSKGPVLKSSKGSSQECRGIVTKSDKKGIMSRKSTNGLYLDASISEEARALLLARLKAITDDQWATAYKIAMRDKSDANGLNRWMSNVYSKIGELEKARCSSIDTGLTVLGKSQ